MKLKFSIAFAFLLNIVGTVSAQELAKEGNYKREFGFKSDNDAYLFYGQDQYYTNGIFISYTQAFDNKLLSSRLENKVWSLGISQKMYNPKSGYSPVMEKQDRPFAASLYASYSQSNFYKKNYILKFGADIGFMGPRALGKEAQELLHNTVGFYDISGWDYQIGNAFLAQVDLSYYRPIGKNKSSKIDWNLGSMLNFGTINNNVNINIIVRAGKLKPFNQSAISGGHLISNSNPKVAKPNESFFYIKPNLSAVISDATLEGNLFKNNSPVTFSPKPFVFSTQIGYLLHLNRFRLDYHLNFSSREVKSSALPHQYGSISIYYQFN